MPFLTTGITTLVETIGTKLKNVFTKTKGDVVNIGNIFMRNFGSKSIIGKLDFKLQKIGKTLKEISGKKVIKGIKKVGKGFGMMLGPIGMFMGILQSLGILTPFMKIFSAIMKVLGGKIMVALLPLIMKFVDILSSPEFMEIVSAIADILIAVLVPVLGILIDILEKLMPYFPYISAALGVVAEVLAIVIGWIELFIKWITGGSPGLIPAIEGIVRIVEILVTGALAILQAVLTHVTQMVILLTSVIKYLVDGALAILKVILDHVTNAFKILANVIQALISGAIKIIIGVLQFLGNLMRGIAGLFRLFIRMLEALRDIIVATLKPLNSIISLIASLTGGGGGKKKKKGREKLFGIFQGGGIIPQTGPYWMEREEVVEPAAGPTLAELVMGQDEMVKYLKAMYKHMRTGM